MQNTDNTDEILPIRNKTSQEKVNNPRSRNKTTLKWNEVYNKFESINTNTQLEEFILDFDESKFENLCLPIVKRKCTWSVDTVALTCMPEDFCGTCLPICTTGDGNCLPRAISWSLFGHENCHLEVRLRILIEGVLNKDKYLDNNFLINGASRVHRRGTFPQQYTLFSGQYFPPTGSIDEVVETIYEKEMLAIKNKSEFMGMWQIWVASTVVGRKIRSGFPMRGSEAFRSDFNRTVVPIDEMNKDKTPLNIMWTPVVENGSIIHFVPLP